MLTLRPILRGSRALCLCNKSYRAASTCTYVLLPEVPPDTAETNTLMDVENLPNWPKVTPSSVYRACGKLAILYETKIGDHCDKMKDLGKQKNFDDVFKPFEEVSVPLQYAYKSVKHLSTVKKKTFSDAYEGIYSHVHKSQAERWQNELLYNTVKELNSNSTSLHEAQRSMIDLYLREGKRAGVELDGKQLLTFQQHQKDLARWQDSFRRAVYFSARQFRETVYDAGAVVEMPEAEKAKLSMNKSTSDSGPWLFSVESVNTYKPVLDYCPDRDLRKKVWQNLMSIGSIKHARTGQNNKQAIDGIRYARGSIAKLIGYNTYADMVMSHRMAGSVENVMEFIETLRSAFQPEAQEELASLQQFASSNGFNDSLQMWDIDYWSRRQKDELFDFDMLTASEYFPYNRVMNGLSQICNALFGVRIKKREGNSTSVWHPTVEVYDVQDESGKGSGVLYVDPYKRPSEKYGGCWVESGRENSNLFTGPPISYINMNLSPTLGKQPALMSVRDVSTLFSSMGHVLQQLMTTVDYSEVAGQNNIEWDALHVCAHLMNMWLFRPDTLKSLSCHWNDNSQLSDSQVNSIIAYSNHMYSNKLMKSLFNSVFDLEMYFSETHWDTATKRLWPRYMLQPLDSSYNEACSMVNVFAEPRQAAGVYGLLWAEMVAAEIMNSFNNCSNLDELKTVGRRFKETYLSLGGSLPAIEVFRRFKGRDPSVNIFIQQRLPHQEKQLSSESESS